MKTLYLSDMDGTLLNEQAELSEYTVTALNRMIAEGLCFSVASARSSETAKFILSKLDLRYPAALMNGAVLYDTKNYNYLDVKFIYPEASENVLKVANEYGVTALLFTIENDIQRTYYEPARETKAIREFRLERREKYGKEFTPVESLDDVEKNNIIYISMMDTYEKLLPISNELEGLSDIAMEFYRNVYEEDIWLLEVFDAYASKENAAKLLKEYYGFEKLVGFGDNLNDLSLFAACDETFAVENARNELKEAASGVIGSNNDDGVIKWLETNWQNN